MPVLMQAQAMLHHRTVTLFPAAYYTQKLVSQTCVYPKKECVS